MCVWIYPISLFSYFFGLVKTYKKQKRYNYIHLTRKGVGKLSGGNPELKGKIEISILPFFSFHNLQQYIKK